MIRKMQRERKEILMTMLRFIRLTKLQELSFKQTEEMLENFAKEVSPEKRKKEMESVEEENESSFEYDEEEEKGEEAVMEAKAIRHVYKQMLLKEVE